jgi:hypothetical protein
LRQECGKIQEAGLSMPCHWPSPCALANPIIRLAFQQLGLCKDIALTISDTLLARFGILVTFIAMKKGQKQ